MDAVKQWVAEVLRAVAEWLVPTPPPPGPTPLERAARRVVGTLSTQPFSSVSKRQIAFRRVHGECPGHAVWEINYALEAAVADLKTQARQRRQQAS
jgi:hypothetical protein